MKVDEGWYARGNYENKAANKCYTMYLWVNRLPKSVSLCVAHNARKLDREKRTNAAEFLSAAGLGRMEAFPATLV